MQIRRICIQTYHGEYNIQTLGTEDSHTCCGQGGSIYMHALVHKIYVHVHIMKDNHFGQGGFKYIPWPGRIHAHIYTYLFTQTWARGIPAHTNLFKENSHTRNA